jgi:hypothetical protein
MPRNIVLTLLALLLLAPAALATTFIVPTDEELIAKADAIVVATVRSHSVTTVPEVQTVYQIRIDRVLKGRQSIDQVMQIVSPGGELKDRGVIVAGAAHFADGERALLFLTRDRLGWTPTDMTLGKFKFKTTTRGTSVLARDTDDIFGWDRSGNAHVERVRAQDAFLRFIEARVRGERANAGYFVASSDVVLEDSVDDSMTLQPNAPAFPAYTYTDNIRLPNNGPYVGTRWPNIAAGATFYKRSDTNIGGAGDGGVSVIQNALASWTNECGSVINLIYGGQRATPSQDFDGISVVEFNDPQGRVAGSWTGQGLVARTFLSYNDPHEFPAGTTWWSILDADVVFQDGYTAANASFATAMTHEIGHGLGWRHSDAHFTRPTGFDEPCQPAVEECSGNAIMTATSIGSLGYTLQTWDQNAAQAVYPGGSCGISGFYVITPCRLLDTRNAAGPYGGPALSSNVARNIVVAGQCGIPAGATAVAINVAAVTPPSLGRLVVYPGPAGSAVPTVSTINFRTGETISNNAIVPISPDGSINIYSTATSPMHAVIDVYGFFR